MNIAPARLALINSDVNDGDLVILTGLSSDALSALAEFTGQVYQDLDIKVEQFILNPRASLVDTVAGLRSFIEDYAPCSIVIGIAADGSPPLRGGGSAPTGAFSHSSSAPHGCGITASGPAVSYGGTWAHCLLGSPTPNSRIILRQRVYKLLLPALKGEASIWKVSQLTGLLHRGSLT